MSRPAPPALTVRYDGSPRTFAAGNDVVVGRDLRADVRIAHPLISRAHLVLRFDQGRWIAIDNGSLNGMYVNGRRVPAVDITDGQQIHIGNPDGPLLTFEVGRHQGSAGSPPPTVGRSGVRAGPAATWPGAAPPPPDRAAHPRRARSRRATRQGRARTPRAAASVRPARRQPSRPAPVQQPISVTGDGVGHRDGPGRGAAVRRRQPRDQHAARSCDRAGPRTSRPGRSRSVARATTTSSSPTCWPRVTTPP